MTVNTYKREQEIARSKQSSQCSSIPFTQLNMRPVAVLASVLGVASFFASGGAEPILPRQTIVPPLERIYDGWLFNYEQSSSRACSGPVPLLTEASRRVTVHISQHTNETNVGCCNQPRSMFSRRCATSDGVLTTVLLGLGPLALWQAGQRHLQRCQPHWYYH